MTHDDARPAPSGEKPTVTTVGLMTKRTREPVEEVVRGIGSVIADRGLDALYDFETAKWLSQMIGQETAGFQTDSFKPGDGPSFSNNLTGRDLLTPDEIMQLPPDRQLLRVQGQATAIAQKLRYYADPEFAGLFTPEAR